MDVVEYIKRTVE